MRLLYFVFSVFHFILTLPFTLSLNILRPLINSEAEEMDGYSLCQSFVDCLPYKASYLNTPYRNPYHQYLQVFISLWLVRFFRECCSAWRVKASCRNPGTKTYKHSLGSLLSRLDLYPAQRPSPKTKHQCS